MNMTPQGHVLLNFFTAVIEKHVIVTNAGKQLSLAATDV